MGAIIPVAMGTALDGKGTLAVVVVVVDAGDGATEEETVVAGAVDDGAGPSTPCEFLPQFCAKLGIPRQSVGQRFCKIHRSR